MSRKTEIQELISKHHRRLQKLREKEATFGLNTPPETLIEIEEIEAKVERLHEELEDLELKFPPDTSSSGPEKFQSNTIKTVQMEEIRSAIAEARLEREDHLREQRSCVVKFYDLIVELMYEKLAVNFGDFPIDNEGKQFVDFQNSFSELVVDVLKGYQRIVVYFEHDHKLRVEAENVLNTTLAARRVFKQHFGKVKMSIIKESRAIISGDDEGYGLAVKASDEAGVIYWKAMEPVILEMREAMQRYLTALNKFLRPSEPLQLPKDNFQIDE